MKDTLVRISDFHGVSPGDSRKRLPVSWKRVQGLSFLFTLWHANDIVVGGWWLPPGAKTTPQAWWFAEKVPVDRFPWILSTRGRAQAAGGCSSTTSELFALLVLGDLPTEELKSKGSWSLSLTMSSEGDNMGCSSILSG